MVSQGAIELGRPLDINLPNLNVARAGTDKRSVSSLSMKDQTSGLEGPESARKYSPMLSRSGYTTPDTHDVDSSSKNTRQKVSGLIKVPFITSRSTEISEGGDNSRTPPDKQMAYVPWTLRRLSLLGTVAFLIALIIALEVLHYLSDRNQGLVTAKESASYLWKYLPTASKNTLWAVHFVTAI
jgi:hypothetical protein